MWLELVLGLIFLSMVGAFLFYYNHNKFVVVQCGKCGYYETAIYNRNSSYHKCSNCKAPYRK